MNIVALDLLRSVFGSSSLVELINLLLISYFLIILINNTWAYKKDALDSIQYLVRPL